MNIRRFRSRKDLDLLKYSRRKFRRGASLQTLGWSAFAVSLGGVLAAAITINTNGLIEFGQGSVTTIVCDRNVDIEPVVTYNNTNQTFTAESLLVTNLNNNIGSGDDQGCGNKTLTISVFSSNGGATPIFRTKLFVGPGSSTTYQEEIALFSSSEARFLTTDIGNITIEQETQLISGTLDNSFSGDGLVITPVSGGENLIFDLALQSNGKIIAVGVDDFATDNDFAIARYLADGTLDTGFNSVGIYGVDFNSNNDDARATAIQSDGKILVAGYTTPGGGDFDFAILRLTTSGALDTDYGAGGSVVTDIAGSDDLIYDIAVDSQDRLIVVGRTQTGSNVDAVVARYTSNGVLDTSFGTSGFTRINSGSNNEYGRSVLIDSSGNIWVGGYKTGTSNLQPAIWKLNSSGTYQSEWTAATGDGDSRIQGMTFTQDGSIAAAGDSVSGSDVVFTAWKLDTSSNSLVAGFGTSGTVQQAVGSGNAYALSIASQRDGKLVIGGQAVGNSNEDFAIIRLNLNNGTLDTSFDSDGILITPIGSSEDLINSIKVQTDGWIVAGGYADDNSSNRDFAIARFR